MEPENAKKIDPALMNAYLKDDIQGFIIVFEAQANLDAARFLNLKEEKGQYVFNRLKNISKVSQQRVRSFLETKNISFQPFFIVNAIKAKGKLDLVRQIAEFDEVKRIIADPWVFMDYPIVEEDPIVLRKNISWGVERMGAPSVWEMGITGQGVVVGGADTGVEWIHAAIMNKYRGNTASGVDHNYNWHDAIREISPIHMDTNPMPELNPCGLNIKIPCDDDSHGTYTLGIMVGDDALGNQIGVAPGATWIASRNMERGYGKPSTYLESFEWFLAPTDSLGANPKPELAPHVINNSWGCPPMEGCNPSNFEIMELAVNSLKAAGVFVVASAGNSGPGCGSVDDPAAIFEHSFTVGAFAFNDSIASFSSRGPVMVDSSGRLKPDIVAPGVGIRSSGLNQAYFSGNGTSAAGPHVAGAVALMISANPDLAGQVDTIAAILKRTARPIGALQNCGEIEPGSIPNNTYGNGRIDVLAAVREALLVSSNNAPKSGNGDIEVFPNPSEGAFFFKMNQPGQMLRLSLFDQLGRLVLSTPWDTRVESILNMDQNLQQGIYYFVIAGNGSIWSGKIVKA